MTFDEVMAAVNCCKYNGAGCRNCPRRKSTSFAGIGCAEELLLDVERILKTFVKLKDCRLCGNAGRCDPNWDGEQHEFYVDCMKHQKKNWRFDDDAARDR